MTSPDPRRRGRRRRPREWLPWLPAISLGVYVVVTAGLYVAMSGSHSGSPSSGPMSGFVAAVVAAVLVGYGAALRRSGPHSLDVVARGRAPRTPWPAPVPPLHVLVVAAAGCWWLSFGVVSMVSRGITDPTALLSRVVDPRASYYGKFDEIGGAVSPFLQLLTLCGLLYWLLIPFTVFYWRRLAVWARTLAVAGVLSYALLFLSTGTQKGIVDICLQGGVSVLVVAISRGLVTWRSLAVAGLLAVVGLGVVISSLGQRTDATSSIMQVPGNAEDAAVLRPLLGDGGARGTVVLRDYVTQGYQGLAYSLELPFEWTYGIGSMRSLSSYLPQYLGLQDPYERTYPVRVEHEFGWSAKEKWATVFPWLASDLTFPGTVLLFGVVGWVLARVWLGFLRRPDAWSVVTLVVLAVFFAFAPANNQLFNDRYSAIGVLQLVALQLLRALRGRVRLVDELHRFVTRAAAYIVRSAARWYGRVRLELLNRVSRRPATNPDGVATVTVTTFAPRLRDVHVALESIARGVERPGRLVLWVDAEVVDEARSMPGLRRLLRRGVEIQSAEAALGPHKKYLHVLEESALDDLVLVLADDDIMYPRVWLSELLERFESLERRSVVSWWAKTYRFAPDGRSLAPYRTWDSCHDTSVRRDHYLMGGSGTVFPTVVLEQLRERGREFLEVTPRADDIWLNLHTLRCGVGVAQVRPVPMPILTVPLTQRTKLSQDNVAGDLNDQYLRMTFTADDLLRLRDLTDIAL